jgi:multiple sugar transport system permease protein
VAICVSVLFGVPAAYSLSRFDFKGKRDMAFFILSTRMAPPIGVLIPMYLLFSRLRLIDTHLALIIMYINLNVSVVVWMMMGFFKDIPVDLEEAALIDGCSRLQALRRVVLPLAAPGLAATMIFCTFLSWNEFMWALILTSYVAKTAPVAALEFIQFRHILWGQLMAAGTIMSFPVLLFALLTQRQLVRGLTLGAIK